MTGSSPLTRGTRGGGGQGFGCQRFIPAHAGNTAARSRPARLWPVHPRSRGEHGAPGRRSGLPVGSSPLTRGTRMVKHNESRGQRFIPAHAGNTRRDPSNPALNPVHPRSRGEHQRGIGLARQPAGSSPLTRGTRHNPKRKTVISRFIPAHAGNTPNDVLTHLLETVHPRSRGEHAAGLDSTTRRCRFIPAHAGNTAPSTKHHAPKPVHPRSRGEHTR